MKFDFHKECTYINKMKRMILEERKYKVVNPLTTKFTTKIASERTIRTWMNVDNHSMKERYKRL